jgi:hypothetical protein
MKTVKALAKDLLCRIGLGSLLIEYCDDCGIRQPLVWWCNDKQLWSEITGGVGTHCPKCFDARAAKLGIHLRWYPLEEIRALGKGGKA